MSTPPPGQTLVTTRFIAGALMIAPVFILVAMVLVLAPSTTGEWPWMLIGIVIAVGLVCAAGLGVVGYRVPALPSGLTVAQAQQRSRTAFMSALFRRYALSSVPLYVGVALGFVAVRGGIATVVVGAVITVALAAYFVWPSDRAIERTQQGLEAGGVSSGLREALGLTARPPGFLA